MLLVSIGAEDGNPQVYSRISETLRGLVRGVRGRAVSKGGRLRLGDRFRYAVFLDNRFPESIKQVASYFCSGFLPVGETIVVYKPYPGVRRRVESVCRSLGVETCTYSRLSEIPKFSSMVVFYPFNAQSNCRVVAQRDCRHVLLLHGESNKPASVKPISRIYDYVLVAGEIACERLVEAGVFRPVDVREGRLIKMGSSVIGRLEGFRAASEAERRSGESVILYSPTWEGGVSDENFSSIENSFGARLLISIVERMSVRGVVIGFHPNTGQRDNRYIDWARGSLQMLADRNIRVWCDVDQGSECWRTIVRPSIRDGVSASIDSVNVPVRLGVSDISAMEAIFTASGVENLVIEKNRSRACIPSTYRKLRKMATIDFGCDRSEIPELARRVCDDLENGGTEFGRFRDACVGYSDPSLAAMNEKQRLSWLTDYLERDMYWAKDPR